MQLYLNGTPNESLTGAIGAEAGRIDRAGCPPHGAEPLAALLRAPSEEDFTARFHHALHHYSALPYPRIEHLACGSTRPERNPLRKVVRVLTDRLLHARILPLWRWLLWHQTSLNRTLADGIRFERERAQQREADLTDRISQLEQTLSQLQHHAPHNHATTTTKEPHPCV